MSNMSYCRFRNTREDLQDCFDNIDDSLENKDEAKARIRLVKLCQKIVDAVDLEDLQEEFNAMQDE